MKDKKIVIPIIVIAVICIIGLIMWIIIKNDKTDPSYILKTYISHIEKQEYEEMYELTTKEANKDTFLTRNKNIYEGIEATNIRISIAKISKGLNSAEIVYNNTMNTIAGEVSFLNTVNLVKQDDTYKIKWSSSMIYPELKETYKIRVSTEIPERGSILDRNGEILAKQQIKAQIGGDIEQRVYPLGEATSHLLGYVQSINEEELKKHKNEGYSSDAKIGKTGIEKIFESRLKGTTGAEIYLVDDASNKVKTIAKRNAVNGENIKLTIDSTLQKKIYEEFKNEKSTSVAINPKTGEILAVVSTPTFDSNDFSIGMTTEKWNELSNDENRPLYNRALANYTPGSSFKPITGAIGLTTNSFTADDNFGRSGTRWQKDSSWKDFYITTLTTYSGAANIRNALIYSDNIYFAKAALKIGGTNFANSLNNIGFNKELETPLGNVKSSYSNTDTFESETKLANSGYGQAEVLVNPIHTAMIYSAFVNEGNMINPYIEYKDNKVGLYYKEAAFTKEATNTIKEALIQVVENPGGTAHSAKTSGITLAGKTGTAETKATKNDKDGREIGWFNCFIADENSEKQLLLINMIEDVQEKGGSHYVVNKVKNIIDNI